MNPRDIERASFGAVPETYPHVDNALEAAAELIKEQTGKLREALNEYIGKCGDLEEELEECRDIIRQLRDTIQELQERE